MSTESTSKPTRSAFVDSAMSNLSTSLKSRLPSGMEPTKTNHSQSFRNRFNESIFWETWVATLLNRCGLWVLHPANVLSANKDDNWQTWDLEVSPDGMYGLRVEIKSIFDYFINPETYAQEDVFVCSYSSFTRKWPGVLAKDGTGLLKRNFLFVSKKTGVVLWLPRDTQVYTKIRHDAGRNETFPAVFAKPSSLRDMKGFVEYVKAIQETDSASQDG